uniref:Putative secreted protein n=1 Tax=Anopheles triannulatus TaxID=58253 RepID=A0A2M4B4U6_9DIPT
MIRKLFRFAAIHIAPLVIVGGVRVVARPCRHLVQSWHGPPSFGRATATGHLIELNWLYACTSLRYGRSTSTTRSYPAEVNNLWRNVYRHWLQLEAPLV